MSDHPCAKHGGVTTGDSYFMCKACREEGIDRCSCGHQPAAFSEAMMSSVSCPGCEQHVMGVGHQFYNIRERWNNGERGVLE